MDEWYEEEEQKEMQLGSLEDMFRSMNVYSGTLSLVREIKHYIKTNQPEAMMNRLHDLTPEQLDSFLVEYQDLFQQELEDDNEEEDEKETEEEDEFDEEEEYDDSYDD